MSTAIEWTDETWNPVRGCSRVSEGCRNCYAEAIAGRFSGSTFKGFAVRTSEGPRWTGAVALLPDKLDEPVRWRSPKRIFVNSMSDLFHEGLPDAAIDRIFATMAQTPQHTYQILTKRADRMQVYASALAALDEKARARRILAAMYEDHPARRLVLNSADDAHLGGFPWPLTNVWLGVSIENQLAANRINPLLATPAAVRFLSVEPLLEAVTLTPWLARAAVRRPDWVIVGGESGPGARPCNVAWVRHVLQQCQRAGVPAFVKQLGARIIDRNDAGFLGEEPTDWPDVIDIEDRIEHDLDGTRDGYQGAPVRIHLHDKKGGDLSEWPKDLRVRQFPQTGATA